MLFSASVTRTLPPGAPSRHAPRCCCCCLVVENHSWLKPLSYFQFSSPSVTQAHLQLVWLTSRHVCANVCVLARFSVCVWTWKEPRAKYAGCHWSAALCPPLRALLSWGVTHLYQMACGVSLSGCVQVQIFCKAPDKHFGVRGCFCLSRPQRLDVADVFFFFGFICNCVHFPLPFVHHCGASCLCLDCLLHWRVGKIWQPIRFCQGSVQEQVPSSDCPEAAGKTECSKWQLILKEALSGF